MVTAFPAIFDGIVSGARFVFTGRGTVNSDDVYSGFNLGTHVGDAPDAVQRNRFQLAQSLEVDQQRLIFMNQVHGNQVFEVDGSWPVDPPECDALVTTRTDVALAVLVADCVPVLLAAPDENVLGVAHAGRRGMSSGVVLGLVQAMNDLGARRVIAHLGPSVCGRCYQVPLEMRENVAASWPLTQSVSWDGRPSVDVAAGVLSQLAPLCSAVYQHRGCTVERADLYSYRRDGVTGRFAGAARLLPR